MAMYKKKMHVAIDNYGYMDVYMYVGNLTHRSVSKHKRFAEIGGMHTHWQGWAAAKASKNLNHNTPGLESMEPGTVKSSGWGIQGVYLKKGFKIGFNGVSNRQYEVSNGAVSSGVRVPTTGVCRRQGPGPLHRG